MAFPKVKISDNGGDTVEVTGNALDVNLKTGTSTVQSYARFTAAETATAISDGTNGIAESVTDCKEIIIQPDSGNSGFIRVGGLAGVVSGVPVSTSNGIRLDAGDTLVLQSSSTDAVLIDGSAASQRIYVMLVR